jgi:hypothetical protein
MRRLLATAVVAGLIIFQGCTHIQTDKSDRVSVDLKVSAPAHARVKVNGKAKCTVEAAGRLLLKSSACLAPGDDGVLVEVPCP